MELHSGETCSIFPQFVACGKRQLELWKNVGIEFNVGISLKKYKFWLLRVLLSSLMFVVQNKYLSQKILKITIETLDKK